ncbi:MAG: Bax inhibitor-1/YccA family protein [Oscillospiraceae bacterium]|nr:Bax inhibitor-1/YccA family protein [Oscillospiraceae bacterium]
MTLTDQGYITGRNPVLDRIGKIAETDDADRCTYAGIMKKLGIFLASIFIGMLLCGIAKMTTASDGSISMGSAETVLLAAAALISLVTPWLAIFIRKTIPVTGTLFCGSVGYLITWMGATLGQQFRSAIVLSFLITVLLVATMGFLYARGMIKADQKFHAFISTACITLIAGSLITLAGGLIPATRGIVSELAANPLLSLGVAVGMVVLGSLFLVSDFDTIRQCVEYGMAKDYEWYASFGLAFSVIWLYFKVLRLVLRFTGNGSRSGKR